MWDNRCTSVIQWLAAAPQAQVVHGAIASMVSLNDLGDKRVRYIDTPHVPHAWESGLLFEEWTKTLFTGDLFTQLGDGPAIGGQSIVDAAIAAEEGFHATALTPATAPTIRALKALHPARLAVMHGSCFAGGCAGELERLAAYCEAQFKAAQAG